MDREDYQKAANALLASVRSKLTGREIEICEYLASGEHDEDRRIISMLPDAKRCPHCDEILDEELVTMARTIKSSDELDAREETFKSLLIQFYQETTNWIDNDGRPKPAPVASPPPVKP